MLFLLLRVMLLLFYEPEYFLFNQVMFFSNADVVEGSRSYENIFVSGGALLADDMILKTIDIGKNTFEMFVVVVNQTAENNEK